jgi:tetratricopeptide (TPR) repeat protein
MIPEFAAKAARIDEVHSLPMPEVPSPEWLPALLELGDNRTLLPNLIRQFRSSGVVPFIGAGLSAPYNLPQWSELLRNLAPDEGTRTTVEGLLAAHEYEAAAQLLMGIKGPRLFQIAFRAAFDGVDIDLTKPSAVRSLARLRHGPIITTNFDRVIETVLNHEGCPLDIIVGEAPAKMSDAFQYDTDVLLKVHGDIQDPAGRVLGRQEYEEAYSRWLAVLLRNVATRCLLFLGCSLKIDRPVQVLADLVRAGHGLTNHYALLSLPNTADEIVTRARQLSEECHILPIWYPSGDHDYVRRILDYLAGELPQELRRNHRQPLFRDIPEGRALLFGRDADELVRLIEGSRIVAVEGNRGVGKTSVALQALRRFMERSTFGALAWVTASARKETLRLSHVLDAVSLAIDFPFKAQTTTAEKEALLADELKRRRIRCLLLLDNYETVADPEIEAFLFDPNRLPADLNILLTLTGRLDRTGVTPYRLDELQAADAAAMFRDRLARDQLEQESDEDVAKLYQVVGGNPLAIEWVVGQMRAGSQLPHLLKRLKEGKADVLRRVFEQSWEGLDARQRGLLTALSIFVRPALEEALQAASGLDEDGFNESLVALIRLYLVKPLRMHEAKESQLTGSRYFVHPFTRDFLEGQRTPADEGVLYPRAASFYGNYVAERGGTPEKEEDAAVRELNGELENIVGVLDGCRRLGAGNVAVPVVRAMARWLFTESHWDVLETWGARAVNDAAAIGDNHTAARILSEVGRTYAYRSDFVRAARTFDQALQFARTTPADRWSIAYLQHHVGESLLRQKKHREALSILQKSLKGFTAIESARSIIGVRYRIAMLAFECRRLARARSLAQQGVEDSVRERWGRLEGFNRRLLGDIAVRLGEFPEAQFQYECALKLVPRTDMRIQALIELSLARLEFEQGRKEKAVAQAVTAVAHFDKLRMPREAEEAKRIAAGLAPSRQPRAGKKRGK